MISTQLPFLPMELPASPQETTKKIEPVVEAPLEGDALARMGGYTCAISWGVKDRAGEWLSYCVAKWDAVRVFRENPDAFQLIKGCDPWAALDDSIVEVFTLMEEKKDVTPAEGVPGAGAD